MTVRKRNFLTKLEMSKDTILETKCSKNVVIGAKNKRDSLVNHQTTLTSFISVSLKNLLSVLKKKKLVRQKKKRQLKVKKRRKRTRRRKRRVKKAMEKEKEMIKLVRLVLMNL